MRKNILPWLFFSILLVLTLTACGNNSVNIQPITDPYIQPLSKEVPCGTKGVKIAIFTVVEECNESGHHMSISKLDISQVEDGWEEKDFTQKGYTDSVLLVKYKNGYYLFRGVYDSTGETVTIHTVTIGCYQKNKDDPPKATQNIGGLPLEVQTKLASIDGNDIILDDSCDKLGSLSVESMPSPYMISNPQTQDMNTFTFTVSKGSTTIGTIVAQRLALQSSTGSGYGLWYITYTKAK